MKNNQPATTIGIQNEGASTVEGCLIVFFCVFPLPASLHVDHLIVVVFCFSRLIFEGVVVVFIFSLIFFCQKRRRRLRESIKNEKQSTCDNVASSTGIQNGGASTIEGFPPLLSPSRFKKRLDRHVKKRLFKLFSLRCCFCC